MKLRAILRSKSKPALKTTAFWCAVIVALTCLAYGAFLLPREPSSIFRQPYYSAFYSPLLEHEAAIPDGTVESQLVPGISEAYTQIDIRKNPPTSIATPSSGAWWTYPSSILSCTRDGDDLLVLVDKTYRLPADYGPSDLVSISTSGIRTARSGLQVRSVVIDDLADMVETVKAEGIDFAALSAFRSYTTQQSTYAYWVRYNGGSADKADQVSARPGHSQHQLGTAIDFTSSEISNQLGIRFGDTAASRWLAQHAWEYGFALAYPSGWQATTGYSYEPWHYRYIGRENAAAWHMSGQILEVWLRGRL